MPLLDLEHRALRFTPSSVDERTRTVELIASTGAGVVREDMEGRFLEVLDMQESAISFARLEGMPLLDNHLLDGIDRVLGVVNAARVEGGQLIMTVQVSERAEPVWRDIKAGILRNVSISYGVNDFVDRVDRQTGQRVRTVTKWTPLEISLVPVGADAGAKIRNLAMPEQAPNGAAPAPTTPQTPPATVTRGDMNREIRALADTFNLGAEFSNGLIDRNASVEEARAEALAAMQRSRQATPPAPHVTVVATHDAPEQIVTRMGEALYATRANPRHKLSEAARPYANMTTLDMARECLRVRGFHYNGFSPADTFKRALQTTSDFSQVFADTANRTLRASYQSVPSVLKQLASEATARDFRAKIKVQMSDAPTLLKVPCPLI